MTAFPFLSEPQIEELENFGMLELTEEICDSMVDFFGADDYSDDGDALASAGWGTDEDYGYFGGAEDW
jgi:hypothetical protein